MAKPARSASAAILLLLAGCSDPGGMLGIGHRVVGINPPYPGPSQTGAYDGSYFGDADLVRSKSPACPRDRTGVVEIGDKRLSFAYQPLMNFNPPIKPDGTMHDAIGPAVLDGRITGDRLVMTVSTPDCETRYALHYLYNHS